MIGSSISPCSFRTFFALREFRTQMGADQPKSPQPIVLRRGVAFVFETCGRQTSANTVLVEGPEPTKRRPARWPSLEHATHVFCLRVPSDITLPRHHSVT